MTLAKSSVNSVPVLNFYLLERKEFLKKPTCKKRKTNNNKNALNMFPLKIFLKVNVEKSLGE